MVSVPVSAFASWHRDLLVACFSGAELLGLGFGEDEIRVQLPGRECCKIQILRSQAQKPCWLWALFIHCYLSF